MGWIDESLVNDCKNVIRQITLKNLKDKFLKCLVVTKCFLEAHYKDSKLMSPEYIKLINV